MVKTIIRNIISNAVKFSHAHSSIDISSEKNDESIVIKIRDYGVGIDDETRKKLFRLNAQHTTFGTANEKGSGLGLVLCNEFIHKLGGRLQVNSRVNEGSEFSILIPVR